MPVAPLVRRAACLAALCLALCAPGAWAGAPGLSLLSGGSFESGPGGWVLSPGAAIQPAAGAPHGRRALRIGEGQSASQDLTGLRPGGTYTVSAWVRLDAVRATAASGYAFLAIYQLDEFGDMVATRDFDTATGTQPWRRVTHTFRVTDDARVVSVRCGLFQAAGVAWFDGFTLVEGAAPADPAGAPEAESLVATIPGLVRSPRGNVAILSDDLPAGRGASNPAAMARTLRAAGFGAALLSADRIADPHVLTRAAFDVVALPCAPAFPAAAAPALRSFLKQGGKLLTTGGYAFDQLLERTAAGWERPAPPKLPSVADARWHYEIPAERLRGRGPFLFSGWLRTLNVAGEGFAFFAVYQYDLAGKLVAFKDVCQIRGTQPWTRQSYDFDVDPRTAVVDIHAGLYLCRGVAWMDGVAVTDGAGRDVLAEGVAGARTRPRAPDVWWPAQAENCLLEAGAGRDGGPALKVRLSYFSRTEERLNTRHGRPGDGLEVAPTQLAIFQADYPLVRAARLRAAPGQAVLAAPRPGQSAGAPIEGWAAIGADGFNCARWSPLIDTADRYGRPRGPAGALMRHYAGTWAGSTWAFFGVTNRDIFAPGAYPGPDGLCRIVAELVRDTGIARVQVDPPCVRPGETATIRLLIQNGGRLARTVEAALEAGGGAVSRRAVLVLPRQTSEVTFAWKAPVRGPGYVPLACSLTSGGAPIDRIAAGVVIRRPAVIAAGPRLSFAANYLRIGGAPRFLFGADDWSYTYTADRETPAQWRFDMAQRRDFGIQIYENLNTGMPASDLERERMLRKMDGMAQLSQAYGQVFFTGLLVGANIAASDEELTKQAEWCRVVARRYRDLPGIIYYLNGDLRCTITDAVMPQWNRFLAERYGTDEALRRAWGPHAVREPLGKIHAVEYWGLEWDDLRAYDSNLFRGWLIRRWTGALIAAIHAEAPGALTSCEFYQIPHEGIDVPEGIGDLDLSNIGYFDRPLDDIRRFPAVLKYSDQRARGKSLGPGEYGVKTHPAWGDGKDYLYHIARTDAQAMDHFLAIPHYTLGLGGSRVHNWCWKDSSHHIFPWGYVFPGDSVEKDFLRATRNQSLLFRQLQPVDRAPAVYVLTPDAHRLGGQRLTIIEGIIRSIHLALGAHVDNLGVLNERNLAAGAAIPPGAKVIFYPLPYTPSDAAFTKIAAWVRAGGTLYLSGDISLDEARRRTRTDRLIELCGVRFVAQRYAGIDFAAEPPVALTGVSGWALTDARPGLRLEAAGARVLASAPDGSPVAFERRLGSGRVLLLADPMELHPTAAALEAHTAVYRQVLFAAGVRPLALEPDDAQIHIMRTALRDGGSVTVLFNADESRPSRTVAFEAGGLYFTMDLARQRPGLVWIDGRGRIRALESSGTVRLGTTTLLAATGQTTVYSADGADLRATRAAVILALAPGPVSIARSPSAGPAVARVGEVREGAWRPFASLPTRATRTMLTVHCSPDDALSIVLAGSPSALPPAAAAVARSLAAW